MLGHISLGVTDLARATLFYDATMAALGHVRVYTGPKSVGYGLTGARSSEDKLLLILEPEGTHPPGPGFHLAFDAETRESVDRFHTAALSNGGTDAGAPGLRTHYGPDYYAAFVIDPFGYKLEAVCQKTF
jgi:catechol 2,3-dioxygenase-like lactoylglutathione lyase family enzyme